MTLGVVTIVILHGKLSYTLNGTDMHTVGFKVTHEFIVIVYMPSSLLTVEEATEIVALPLLSTVAVNFEKSGLVVKVLVKAQPVAVVVNRTVGSVCE